MEFNPWRISSDYNLDELYEFQPIGETGILYVTQITVDGLNMDEQERSNICRVSCTCQDYIRRRRICKHIIECTNIVNKVIKVRTEEGMRRYWCSTCHGNINTHEDNPKCYDCQNEMMESNVDSHNTRSGKQ